MAPKAVRGPVGVGRVELDVGVAGVEPLGDRVNVIPAFGHCHGHDTDGGIGHLADQRSVAFFDRQVVDHRSDHLGRYILRIKLDQRCQAILRQKLFTHGRIIGPDACADDRPVVGLAVLHQAMQVPGLVGPVKIADTDMHDARCQPLAIISGAFDGKLIERCIRK